MNERPMMKEWEESYEQYPIKSPSLINNVQSRVLRGASWEINPSGQILRFGGYRYGTVGLKGVTVTVRIWPHKIAHRFFVRYKLTLDHPPREQFFFKGQIWTLVFLKYSVTLFERSWSTWVDAIAGGRSYGVHILSWSVRDPLSLPACMCDVACTVRCGLEWGQLLVVQTCTALSALSVCCALAVSNVTSGFYPFLVCRVRS